MLALATTRLLQEALSDADTVPEDAVRNRAETTEMCTNGTISPATVGGEGPLIFTQFGFSCL